MTSEEICVFRVDVSGLRAGPHSCCHRSFSLILDVLLLLQHGSVLLIPCCGHKRLLLLLLLDVAAMNYCSVCCSHYRVVVAVQYGGLYAAVVVRIVHIVVVMVLLHGRAAHFRDWVRLDGGRGRAAAAISTCRRHLLVGIPVNVVCLMVMVSVR